MLIIVGVLMLTGWFQRLATWLQPFTPEFLYERI